ncbi:MAG: IS30 family transposase [Dinoroseobacter sp.]
MGTVVGRKTRFVVLCKMKGNGAEVVLDSFTRQMKRLPAAKRKSMTYDRGSEMACYPELEKTKLKCPLLRKVEMSHLARGEQSLSARRRQGSEG